MEKKRCDFCVGQIKTLSILGAALYKALQAYFTSRVFIYRNILRQLQIRPAVGIGRYRERQHCQQLLFNFEKYWPLWDVEASAACNLP